MLDNEIDFSEPIEWIIVIIFFEIEKTMNNDDDTYNLAVKYLLS